MAKTELLKRDMIEVLKDLPEVCYSRRITDGYPILLKRGVIGYWTAAPTIVPEERNETMGINVAQEQAMVTDSFAGFDCPGADPLNYTEPTMYAKLEAMRLENKAKYAGTIFKPEQALV